MRIVHAMADFHPVVGLGCNAEGRESAARGATKKPAEAGFGLSQAGAA